MNEAEKSIETQRKVAITTVRPFMRTEVKDQVSERPEKPERMVHRNSKKDQPGSRLARASLQQAIAQPKPPRKSEPPVYVPTRKVRPSSRMEINERIGLVSRSKREETLRRSRLDNEWEPPKAKVQAQQKKDLSNLIIKRKLETEAEPVVPVKKPFILQDLEGIPNLIKEAKKDIPIDSRVVEYEPEITDMSTDNKSSGSEGSSSGSQGVPEILEDIESEEFILDPDETDIADDIEVYKEDQRNVNVKLEDKQKDKTRFVVTLDGVDNEQYEILEDMNETSKKQVDVVMETETEVSQHKKPPVPPKIQPFSISLKDSDEEGEPMEEDAAPLKKVKMMERCKFWPACVNGSACEYHHPTVHCKTFPQCKFGDRCLYIHPNCRYDAKCMRFDCPYTHSSRRSIPTQVVVVPHALPPPPPAKRNTSAPQCKFFPACSNMNCPFIHPKPCRFGISCKNRGGSCPYYHPPLPTKDKLKWEAEKGSAGSKVQSGIKSVWAK